MPLEILGDENSPGNSLIREAPISAQRDIIGILSSGHVDLSNLLFSTQDDGGRGKQDKVRGALEVVRTLNMAVDVAGNMRNGKPPLIEMGETSVAVYLRCRLLSIFAILQRSSIGVSRLVSGDLIWIAPKNERVVHANGDAVINSNVWSDTVRLKGVLQHAIECEESAHYAGGCASGLGAQGRAS